MCIAYVELHNQILSLEVSLHVQEALRWLYVCGKHNTADGVSNLVLPISYK